MPDNNLSPTFEDVKAALEKVREFGTDANNVFVNRASRFDLQIKTSTLELRFAFESQPSAAPESSPERFATPAWNKAGHGVVAFIARNFLSSHHPDIWEKYDGLLKADTQGRDSIALAARWPDDMKRDTDFYDKTHTWHFIDIPYTEGKSPLPIPTLPSEPHAVSKLAEFCSQFDTTQGAARGDALAWILHLVGDIHQPLHCATRINGSHPAPNGDHGGNGFKFSNSYKDLHTLWDGLIARSGKELDEPYLENLAAHIIDDFPESHFSKSQLAESNPEAWAKESFLIAAQYVYPKAQEGSAPSVNDDYMIQGRHIARERSALGGYRLARLLISLAGHI